jgi:predicted DsbA family dithiol-disulfide isomerase
LERRFGAQVEWLPFSLHPEYPPEGIPRSSLEQRYGPGVHGHTQQVIEAAGLTFNPPDTLANTRHALEVTELARDRGLHEAVHTRLMHAFWSEARDIGDDGVLLELVDEAGLDPDEAREAIADGRYAERVEASTQAANRQGVYAIPAFVLGGRLLVLGAQPEGLFERAVEQLRAA